MRIPQQERSRDSALLVMDAALALMESGGLSAVTIAAVSELSGVSNGAIYHRFGNRITIIEAVQERLLEQFEAEASEAVRSADALADNDAALRAVVRNHVQGLRARRRAVRALMVEGQDEDRLQARGSATSHRLQEGIARWLEARFACEPARAVRASYVVLAPSITRAVFPDGLLMADDFDDDDLTDTLVDAVRGIIGAQSGRSRKSITPATTSRATS